MRAWSYSALTKFETCPKQFYETRVAKRVVEPETEQLRWGNAVHKALERRAKEGAPLPTGMTQWEAMMRALDQTPGELLAESQFAITQDFEQTQWFDKSVWLRAVIDYGRVSDKSILALDYKTGKPKPDTDQLRLFAGVLLRLYPQIEKAVTGYVWLKTKQIQKEVFTRADLDAIWGGFLPRVARLQQAYQDDAWPAKPSGLCRGWCPVTSCEFFQHR